MHTLETLAAMPRPPTEDMDVSPDELGGTAVELLSDTADSNHTSEQQWQQQRLDELHGLEAFRNLTFVQRGCIERLDALLDHGRQSVVVTDALSPNAPIVYVTSRWESMCGYDQRSAVGCNPRLTQGPETDRAAIEGMRLAVKEQRACKIRVVNYRGFDQQPFWNCLSVGTPTLHATGASM